MLLSVSAEDQVDHQVPFLQRFPGSPACVVRGTAGTKPPWCRGLRDSWRREGRKQQSLFLLLPVEWTRPSLAGNLKGARKRNSGALSQSRPQARSVNGLPVRALKQPERARASAEPEGASHVF